MVYLPFGFSRAVASVGCRSLTLLLLWFQTARCWQVKAEMSIVGPWRCRDGGIVVGPWRCRGAVLLRLNDVGLLCVSGLRYWCQGVAVRCLDRELAFHVETRAAVSGVKVFGFCSCLNRVYPPEIESRHKAALPTEQS